MSDEPEYVDAILKFTFDVDGREETAAIEVQCSKALVDAGFGKKVKIRDFTVVVDGAE